MNEAVTFKGSFYNRMNKMFETFKQCDIGVKRLFVQKSGKINLTLLFSGSVEEKERLRIFLNSHFPTVDNATIFIHNDDKSLDYEWKIELIDVMCGK